MDRIRCRKTRREATQQITVHANSGSIREQIERLFVDRLKGVPSEWGMMVDDKLDSIEIGEFAVPESYGTKTYYRVPVKISYYAIGYIVGDVILNVSLSDDIDKNPSVRNYRAVNILGLPFQILVRTTSTAPIMSIQITKVSCDEGLVYLAKPAFYPFYSPLAAHLANPPIPNLYSDAPKGKADITVDPLFGMEQKDRLIRIINEVRRFLGITQASLNEAKIVAKPSIVNRDGPFGGSAIPTEHKPSDERPIIIEFISIDSIDKMIRSEKVSSGAWTILYVPSIPVFSGVVVFVSVLPSIARYRTPTLEQVDNFKKELKNLVDVYASLSIANQSIAADLKAEYAKAAEKIRSS